MPITINTLSQQETEFHFLLEKGISTKSMSFWNLDEKNHNLLSIFNQSFEKIYTLDLSKVDYLDKSIINLLFFILTALVPYIVLSLDKKYAVRPEWVIDTNGQISLTNLLIPLDNISEFSENNMTYYVPKVLETVRLDHQLTTELWMNKVTLHNFSTLLFQFQKLVQLLNQLMMIVVLIVLRFDLTLMSIYQ